MTTPVLTGQKPVAWSGGAANVTLFGVPANSNMTFTLDGASVSSTATEWLANNTVTVIVPAGNATAPTVKLLQIDVGGGSTYPVNVTVFPEPQPVSFAEDPIWLEMFESGASGWNITGWTLDTLSGIISSHGLNGKQRFTRGSGVMAAALGEGTHSLASPAITLDGSGNYELRFASHYNISNAPAGQKASVSVSYGDLSAELVSLNATAEGALVRAKLNPPNNTAAATFTFSLEGGGNNSFWLIDDVQIVHPLGDVSGEPLEVIDIISDIQGMPQSAQMSASLLPGLRKLKKASTLVINGDLVDNDSTVMWNNFTTELNGTQPREYYNDLLMVLGNHEMYYNDMNSAQHIDNFLQRTEMGARHGEQGRGVWGEHITKAGTPIIWMASEYYNFNSTVGQPPYVVMSDTQFLYLANRLAYWREQSKTVLLFSHYPMPFSVSGTWGLFDRTSYEAEEERMRYLLASNPHVLFVNSHTHYDVGANDQNVHFRPLVGNDNTVPSVNTGATLNYQGVGSNDWEYASMGTGRPTGLQAEVYADRIRVKAYVFWNLTTDGTLMNTFDVGVPKNTTAGGGGGGGSTAKSSASRVVTAGWGLVAAVVAAALVA